MSRETNGESNVAAEMTMCFATRTRQPSAPAQVIAVTSAASAGVHLRHKPAASAVSQHDSHPYMNRSMIALRAPNTDVDGYSAEKAVR